MSDAGLREAVRAFLNTLNEDGTSKVGDILKIVVDEWKEQMTMRVLLPFVRKEHAGEIKLRSDERAAATRRGEEEMTKRVNERPWEQTRRTNDARLRALLEGVSAEVRGMDVQHLRILVEYESGRLAMEQIRKERDRDVKTREENPPRECVKVEIREYNRERENEKDPEVFEDSDTADDEKDE